MNKIELLKVEIERMKFKLNQEHSRFLTYIVLIIVLLLTGDLTDFNWHWVFIILLLIVIAITLDRLIPLRKELNKKYENLFKQLKKKK